MRILLLSMARTRSSVLIDALSKKYQVPNLYEKYSECGPDTVSKLVLFKKPENLWQKFKTETRKKTDEFMLQDSFAIKLFVGNILNDYQVNPKYNKNPNWSITNDSFLDLETYFDVSKYDQIYILNRENITDVLCSYWHALNKNLFLTDNEKVAAKLTPKGVININDNVRLYFIKTYIIYKKYLNDVADYLDNKNIKYTKLDYDDVPNYLKENFTDIKLSTIDTNYDYKNSFENYKAFQQEVDLLEKEMNYEYKNFF
jgi:hypothetical protein